MKLRIRPYQHSDFDMLAAWWASHNEIGAHPGMLVEDGTFIAEDDGVPIASLTVYTTQASMAYIEALISNPHADKDARREAVDALWMNAYRYAASKGKKHVLTYANKPKLVARYEGLGMVVSPVNGLQALYRVLKES